MADPESTCAYTAFSDKPPPQDTSHRWRTILLAVLLGIGVHAEKESLGPAEPALEALGLGPFAYSLLTVAPVALGLATPVLWGFVWDRWSRWVLIGAPLGELIGALLVAAGLVLIKSPTDSHTLAALCLGGGLLCMSACRAGISIAEFSAVGHASGRYSFIGFASLVVAKHGMGSAMAWAVPHVLAGEKGELSGLLRVQLLVVIPHCLALCSGLAMAMLLPARAILLRSPTNSPTPGLGSKKGSKAAIEQLLLPPTANEEARSAAPAPPRPPTSLYHNTPGATGAGGDYDRETTDSNGSPNVLDAAGSPFVRSLSALWTRASNLSSQERFLVVAMLGLWRALQVGALHAYHSVRIEMLVQLRGIKVTEAGSFFALSDVIALALLPLLALLSRRTRLRPWLHACRFYPSSLSPCLQ